MKCSKEPQVRLKPRPEGLNSTRRDMEVESSNNALGIWMRLEGCRILDAENHQLYRKCLLYITLSYTFRSSLQRNRLVFIPFIVDCIPSCMIRSSKAIYSIPVVLKESLRGFNWIPRFFTEICHTICSYSSVH